MNRIALYSFRVMGLLTALALTQGCGNHNDSSILSDQPKTRESILMIVLGGNRSCKPDDNEKPSPLAMDMAPRTISAIDKLLSDGIEAAAIITCFVGSDRILLSRNFSKNLSEIEPTKIVDLISDDVPATQKTNTKVHIIGHSYGGWLAIKMAAKIIASGNEVDSLVTIDPISRDDCTYTNWTNCFGAPIDVQDETLAMIKNKTGHWANYYQNTTYYLHSGRIEFADHNENLDASHYDIDTHETIWRKIENRLGKSRSLAEL